MLVSKKLIHCQLSKKKNISVCYKRSIKSELFLILWYSLLFRGGPSFIYVSRGGKKENTSIRIYPTPTASEQYLTLQEAYIKLMLTSQQTSITNEMFPICSEKDQFYPHSWLVFRQELIVRWICLMRYMKDLVGIRKHLAAQPLAFGETLKSIEAVTTSARSVRFANQT